MVRSNGEAKLVGTGGDRRIAEKRKGRDSGSWNLGGSLIKALGLWGGGKRS